jgi:hypothetical protein
VARHSRARRGNHFYPFLRQSTVSSRTPLDLLVEEAGVLALEEIDRRRIGGAVRGEHGFRRSTCICFWTRR